MAGHYCNGPEDHHDPGAGMAGHEGSAKILKPHGAGSANMMLAEPEIFGVDQRSETTVIIKGRIRTLPITQWDVAREYLRRIKHAFDQNKIDIPLQYSPCFSET